MLNSTATAPAPSSGVSAPSEMTERQPVSGEPIFGLSRQVWVPIVVLGVLLFALYYRVVIKLVSDWYNIPDYSHGLLIPFFVLYLVWDKRHTLLATPVKPSWAGIWPVVLGLMILLVGVFGADLFLSRISFVILMAGIILLLLGRSM